MLKIGKFSKLSGVSVRMLRHYDEIGLINRLRPTAARITGTTARTGSRQRDVLPR